MMKRYSEISGLFLLLWLWPTEVWTRSKTTYASAKLWTGPDLVQTLWRFSKPTWLWIKTLVHAVKRSHSYWPTDASSRISHRCSVYQTCTNTSPRMITPLSNWLVMFFFSHGIRPYTSRIFRDRRSAPGGRPGSHHVFRGRFRFRSWHRGSPNFGEDSHGWKKWTFYHCKNGGTHGGLWWIDGL